MLRSILAAAVTLQASPPSASAAPAASPPKVWDLEWQAPHCTITTGTADTLGFAIWTTPGSAAPLLYVIRPKGTIPSGSGEARVTLGPNGQSYAAQAVDLSKGPSSILRLGLRDGDTFLRAFAEASSVRVTKGARSVEVDVSGSDKAVAALRECEDQTLSEWGIDPVAWRALKSPPKETNPGHWLGPDDYPVDALKAGFSGEAVAKLSIDASGKVTDCTIVGSSGMHSIDLVTCEKARKLARFDPAIGPDGTPVAAARVIVIAFATS